MRPSKLCTSLTPHDWTAVTVYKPFFGTLHAYIPYENSFAFVRGYSRKEKTTTFLKHDLVFAALYIRTSMHAKTKTIHLTLAKQHDVYLVWL